MKAIDYYRQVTLEQGAATRTCRIPEEFAVEGRAVRIDGYQGTWTVRQPGKRRWSADDIRVEEDGKKVFDHNLWLKRGRKGNKPKPE